MGIPPRVFEKYGARQQILIVGRVINLQLDILRCGVTLRVLKVRPRVGM